MARPESLTDIVQRMIRTHASRIAQQEGYESFEEANDFDLPEDEAELNATRYEEMGEDAGIEATRPVAPGPGLLTNGTSPPSAPPGASGAPAPTSNPSPPPGGQTLLAAAPPGSGTNPGATPQKPPA